MAQQFEQPSKTQPSETGSELRTQRMTADESRAVIALWQQERVEQTGLTDKPAVPDVAEGLDITIEDVQRLLQDVRAKRPEEERALASEQELSEIRLAEEERKLAEIRRQRAEQRREQATLKRHTPSRMTAKQSNAFWLAPTILLTVAGILWLGYVVYSTWIVPPQGGCILALPDGTSQPCGPDYYRAHPETK